jgi:hypothetical protein
MTKKKKPAAVDDAIERALAPYLPLFSAETIELMRAQMREYATTHPYPVALLRQLDAADVKESHVRSKNGATHALPTDARRAKS